MPERTIEPASNTNLLLQYVGDYTSPIRPSQPQNIETEEQVGGGPQHYTTMSGNVPSELQGNIDTQMKLPDNLPPSDIEPTSSEDEEDQPGMRELREDTPSPAPRNAHAATSVQNAYRCVPTNKTEGDANQPGINHQVRGKPDDTVSVKGELNCRL